MIILFRKIFNIPATRYSAIIAVIILLQSFVLCAAPKSNVIIIAHQGVLEEAPENTMVAFKRAVQLGAKGLMVDVRRTKDNVIVLMKDKTIDRTTDGKGVVDQLYFDELRTYDAGLWRGRRFKGAKIPLLSEALKFAKANRLKLVLNVKQFGLENYVLSLVKEYDMVEDVFFLGILRNISKLEPELPIHNVVFSNNKKISKDLIRFVHSEDDYVATKMLDSDDRELLRKSINKKFDIVILDYVHLIMDVLHINELKPIIPLDYTDYFRFGTVIKQNNSYQSKKLRDKKVPYETRFIRDNPETFTDVILSDNRDDSRMAALAVSTSYTDSSFAVLIDLLKNKQAYVRQNAVWALGMTKEKSGLVPIMSKFDDNDVDVKRESVLALKKLLNSCKFTNDEVKKIGTKLVDMLTNDRDPNVRYDVARTLQDLRSRETVIPLVDALRRDPDWSVKSACAGALGAIRDQRGVKPLKKELMKDSVIESTWTKKRSAWALAEIGPNAVDSLIEAMNDNEKSTRRRASWALLKIGKPAVQALVGSLKDKDKFIRERAALTLGWMNDDYAINALIWRLQDKEPEVRRAAVWALGRLGDSRALDSLQTIRKDKNISVRLNVMESIKRIKANKKAEEK